MDVDEIKEETNTYPGQVYEDDMFNCDVLVTKADDERVFVRDAELVEEKGKNGGSWYPWGYWTENKQEHYRFTLKEDISDSEKDKGGKNGLFDY